LACLESLGRNGLKEFNKRSRFAGSEPMFSFVNGMMFDLQGMWLSHHDDDHLERCIVVADRHVCRRCAVLYPFALVVLAVLFVVDLPRWFMFALPLPAVGEFVAENMGLRYHPIRQMALTAIAAPALGMGFARAFDNPFDGTLWSMVAICVVPCLFAVWLRANREQRVVRHLREHTEENHPVLKGFGSASEFQAYLDATEAAVSRANANASSQAR
jgi:hypothetical protein